MASSAIHRRVLAATNRIGHHRVVGTGVALVMAVGLAVIPFRYGSGRWRSEWLTTTYGIGAMMFVVFMPWFVVALAIGASRALVPVTMILFAVAYGAGHWLPWRRFRQRR